jgi:hypothetical protein
MNNVGAYGFQLGQHVQAILFSCQVELHKNLKRDARLSDFASSNPLS